MYNVDGIVSGKGGRAKRTLGLLDSFEFDLYHSPQNCSSCETPHATHAQRESTFMRARKVRPVCPSKYTRANSENRLRMYARSRTDTWKIVQNCVPFFSRKNACGTTILILLRFQLFLREIIAHGLCYFARYRVRRKERRRSGSRNSLSSIGCKNGLSFTKELVRFFPGRAFRYRGKSERKTKLCIFALGSIGGDKKKACNREGFSSTFLHFFF